MPSFIDRAIAREHLKLAEKHVAEGQQRTDAQLALVARLERSGLETSQAKTLLHQFEEILALQVETRDRVARELGERM
jgi:hypothetical protein